MKRWVGNTVSAIIAVIAGLLTIQLSLRYLKQPQGWIDWVVLVLSGLTTGTIAFFMSWGHFQEEPSPATCPGCGAVLLSQKTAEPVSQPRAFGLYCEKCHWKSGDSQPTPK